MTKTLVLSIAGLLVCSLSESAVVSRRTQEGLSESMYYPSAVTGDSMVDTYTIDEDWCDFGNFQKRYAGKTVRMRETAFLTPKYFLRT